MAELVLGAFLQALFEKLASGGISQFLKLVKGKKIEAETIQNLEQTLRLIAALLTDAEQRQTECNSVKLWLEDLQDAAYDLEDILDEFATRAQLHLLKKEHDDIEDSSNIRLTRFVDSTKHRVKSVLACGSTSTVGQHFQYSKGDLSSSIKEVSIRLQHVLTQARDLGLSATGIIQQETHRTEAPNESQRQSTSIVCEPVIYGRDGKKNEIIKKLKDEPSYGNFVVIPIVGMGGVGKTTLAQYVYNDEQQLEDHFDLKAWVCVSDVFDVTRVTTEILNSFTKGSRGFSNLNQAQENLMEVLKGKKFLLVLDDIWSENYNDWNQLQTPFRRGSKGSGVIVTTRKDITARMVISNPTHNTTIYLKGLSDDDCWCIFQQHTNAGSDLSEMRDDIIRKCAGLPLAAKALGGLLKSTVEKRQHRSILDSTIWSEKSHVLPALRLSYHHLPSDLKRSFAYCSVLPKDYKFDEMEVVLLWMAQGFLPENSKESTEDVGHNYFFDLVSRSLFEECPSYGGGSRKFIMHDLIHDLAQWASGDMCCVMGTTNTLRNLRRTRHIFLTKNGVVETLGNQLLSSQVRTFLSPSYGTYFLIGLNIEILDYIRKFRYIRALRLSLNDIEELPEYIGELMHLRYLILIMKKIRVLPKSLSKLCNLQTLELRYCKDLQQVPDVRFLVKLRHLYIDSTSLQEMPLGMGRLKSLQTLNRFVLAAGGGSRVIELSNLNHLNGNLRISGLENLIRVEDAHEARLHEKKCLDKLILEWGTCRNEVDDNNKNQVLEHLTPHTSIKECYLKGYRGSTFPTWLGDPSFSNMVTIQLVFCIDCERLPPLGQLPLLMNLFVQGMEGIKQVGLEFYGPLGCSVPFPALETLNFFRLKSWKKWLHLPVENNKAFPRLKKLSIKSCSCLQDDIPPNLSSLEELEIMNCKELSISLPSLPLLEMLVVDGCKVLSTTEDDIFCSIRMKLHNIMDITASTGRFPHLREELTIYNCDSVLTLDQIPMSLRRLKIDDCHKLQSVEFESSSPFSPCLEKLRVESCPSVATIIQIPWTIQSLHIDDCQKLQAIEFNYSPRSSLNGKILEERAAGATTESVESLEVSVKPLGLFPKVQCELSHLIELTITECPHLISLQEGLLFPALKQLNLSFCYNMEGLPSQMHMCTALQNLYIKECPGIDCFPEGGLPKNLIYFYIEGVNIKQPIQEWGLHLLNSLVSLYVKDVGSSSLIPCPDLSIPSSLSELHINGFQNLKSISCCSTSSNLTLLEATDCQKFEFMVGDFTLLADLSLKSCPTFPHFIGSLPMNLSDISMCDITNIDKPIQEWGLHRLTSLHSLTLNNVGSSVDLVECIPGPNLYLPSLLIILDIVGFPNLKTICCSSFPNLTTLHIKSCPKFESFGDDGLPPHLIYVHIYECDLYEQLSKSNPEVKKRVTNSSQHFPMYEDLSEDNSLSDMSAFELEHGI